MSSPLASSNAAGSSRRSRVSRSPSPGVGQSSKRSKPSSSSEDQHRLYTSICVKNINPKISDPEVRELCNKKFSKYGSNSVKIYYKNQERMAFVNFTNCEDARKARHAKTGLVWEKTQVVLEPVYYRRTIPPDQPIVPGSPRDRSPPSPRRRPPRRPSPSPPRSRHRSRSPRHHRASPPPRPRRTYSPYIPLPPDLLEYVGKEPGSKKGESSSKSPSPSRYRSRRRTPSKSRSPSKSRLRSPSPSHSRSRSTSKPRAYKTPEDSSHRNESNVQHEPTRTLFVGNLERDIKESKIREVFGRYGTIEEVDLKVPQSSSKRAYAFIQYENMDMAYEARRAMDGHFIGKADCKIGYGKIVPTNCLWVGNIPMEMKRRDLEEAFSRYGEVKSFDYTQGDPTAIVTYHELEDAIKARGKMVGVTRFNDGHKTRAEPDSSDSTRRAGLRIDYLDRPTTRRFVIVRPQETSTKRRSSRSSSDSSASSKHSATAKIISPEPTTTSKSKNDLKEISSESRSPSPNKSRNSSPSAPGRTFHKPLGCYFTSNETKSINNMNEFIGLCEKFHRSNPSIYSVDFILKTHVHPARLHFLAGNPQLANEIFGDPGDRTAKKAELKVTQRLRLDQQKCDELMKKLRDDVNHALTERKSSPAQQTKFSVLFTSVKNGQSNGKNKPSGHSSNEKEDEADSSLTQFFSYLTSKEAAGVITMTLKSKNNENESKSVEIHIFPACQFSKEVLKLICPTINFSNGPHTPPSRPSTAIGDEHLLVVITHSDEEGSQSWSRTVKRSKEN